MGTHRAQEPVRPQVSTPCAAQVSRETLARRELCWGWPRGWHHPDMVRMAGEHQGWSPFPDTASLRQEFSGSSPKRRRAEDKDEGIGSPDIWEDEKAEDLRREMIELRQQLDKERSVRMMLEEQVRPCGAGSGCSCGAAACAAPRRLYAGRARPLAGSATAELEPPPATPALPWCKGV